MSDEPGAIWMPVPTDNVFSGYWGNIPKWVVIHKTASAGTAQDIANFFANDPAKASSHYIIGTDGTIVQCVSEADGAGANCCLETGYAAFLPTGINLNLLTISIEHCDSATDNSTPLTDAQKAASFRLVKDICQRHNIPMRPGDAAGGIIGHSDIDPVNRARCPGNYPMAALLAFLASQEESYMEQQFNDVWFSKAYAFKSGIYQAVLDAFRAQKVSACYPLGPELKTVDWNGASIQFQALSNGLHAEWNNSTGACHLYDAQNRQVA